MGDCGLLSESHPLPAPTSHHVLPDSGQPAGVWRAGVTWVGMGATSLLMPLLRGEPLGSCSPAFCSASTLVTGVSTQIK